ncbi:MAG: molecular chaperone TorD family protein [Dehalococcoidia bacterium]
MNAEATDIEIRRALRRSAVYGILARAFGFPSDERRREMATLAGGLDVLGAASEAQAAALVAAYQTTPQAAERYARLFTHSSSRDCPSFETAYTAWEIFQQTQEMADIAGFYAAFGVQIAPSGDRPDSVTTELEFMGFLAAKEAYARQHLGAARTGQARRAQRLFLREHLGCWGPAFGRRLATIDADGWYGRAGVLLARWLGEECEALSAPPASVIDAPRLHWGAPDSDTCGPEESEDPCAGCDLAPGAAPPVSIQSSGGAMPLPLVEQVRHA